MAVVFGLAAALGLYLAYLGGLPIILIGIAAIISAIAYTGGPFPLGYYGLGDIFVFIFFGLASVAGTYYVQAGFVSPAAWWMTIPPGMIITAILVVNNLRDLENDRKAGKHTLAVIFGERVTKIQYMVCLALAYLIMPIAAWVGIVPWTSLLTWVSLPIAYQAARSDINSKGAATQCGAGKHWANGAAVQSFILGRAVVQLTNFHGHKILSSQSTVKYKPSPSSDMAITPAYMAG
jgi:1,4-dihydroxy-2-naphthoate polyprenyltransferase